MATRFYSLQRFLEEIGVIRASRYLRSLLVLRFGGLALGALVSVVLLSSIALHTAGRIVQRGSDQFMRLRVTENLLRSSQLVTDSLALYLEASKGSAEVLAQAVQTSIIGYPLEGWDGDRFMTEFTDAQGNPQYPIRMPPPLFDWQIVVRNLNSTSAIDEDEVDLQERWTWLRNPELRQVSTASASFFVQGICDPAVTNVSSPVY